MKYLFISPTLDAGGAERTVIQIANSFAMQGLTVHLGVGDLSGARSKLLPEVNSKIKVINFNCGRVAKMTMPLKRQMQIEQYDYLISTQTHTNIIAVLAKILSTLSTRLILREVSTPSINNKQSAVNNFILKKIVKFTYPRAYKVICVSKGVELDFKNYYMYNTNNLTTIYNPVIDNVFFEKIKAHVQHHFFKESYKVILAVGRLTEAKNFKFLIHSFKELHNKYAETRLIILGEGELRGELEALISNLGLSEVVDLPGFDPNPYAYFKYVSLFVLSSNWEGLPGVLIQALASKVKVVSTNCPNGPLEILDNSKFGILVECNNQFAMINAMEKAIFKNYISYSEQAYATHIQKFHINTILEQYLDVMKFYRK